MKTAYVLLTVLIFGLLITSAQAQKGDAEAIGEIAKSLNERANWELFYQIPNRDIELYDDSKNITYVAGDAAIVAVKTVYKSEEAINELRKERDRRMGSKRTLQYDGFSFSIVTFELLCSKKNIKSEAITVDFDTQGNVLNLVPTHTGIIPIYPDTFAEKLYNIICTQKKKQ